MRKQYYFRPSSRGLLAWDVDRLVELSKDFPRKSVELTSIHEIDEPWFGDEESQTWRAMLDHIKLIEDSDLSFPIILAADGRVMDGMHRVAKAILQGEKVIEGVQFPKDPEPDYIGIPPDELPYEPQP